STQLVESILEFVKASLESGEDVMLSRFGKFSVNKKDARRGRNPATGDDITLGARRVVTFRCSPVLKGKMNGKI
ncbi:MAG: integration host factor subunit alpha, partial [Thermodesulfobacteriota bacterium]|nr:integration host factor subunit alpha [Thermodesulfobacteriota bacterium]